MPSRPIDSGVSRRRRPSTRLIAVAAVLQLLAAIVAIGALDRPGPAATPTDARARVAPAPVPAVDPEQIARDARTDAVNQLLAARSKAVLDKDRAAFLATIDPEADGLLARQEKVFEALQQVPIGTWNYQLDPALGSAPNAQLDEKYGVGTWWAPDVTFGYSLDGFDERPTTFQHHLTFVERGGAWLLAADDDFDAIGRPTPPGLWDEGPVQAVRSDGVLVLGHPDSLALMKDLAALTAAAIPAVTKIWGPEWKQRAVVIVPDDADELAQLLDSEMDFSQIAAVATAELAGGDDYDPAGDRILVNPDNFAGLGPVGRRVVLKHELTHVASRAATGPGVPAWLAEGLADYVGYTGVKVPLSVAARELKADVRAGRLPATLPTDADFDGGNLNLAQAYEQSWLAVRLLVEQMGRPGFLEFYRDVGARRGMSAEEAVQAEFAARGSSTAEFIEQWRAALTSQLG